MEGLRPPGAAGGAGGEDGAASGMAARASPLTSAAAEAGSMRLQFDGRKRLGGCVAWDSASGLLAVELLPGGGGAGHNSRAAATSSFAIIDPQAPESHFVAHVPASTDGAADKGLAALLWSPPCCRRLLLAVTSNGAAYSWTMDEAASSAAAAAAAAAAVERENGMSSGANASGSQVPCVNQWFGQLAFRLPLPAPSATPPPVPPSAAAGCDSAEQLHPPRLLCCRFLEAPSAAVAWNVRGAPPHADRPLPPAKVVAHYRHKGLEQAFAPAAGAAAPAAPVAALGQPELPLHWLRPGLLCVAAVTNSGQLLLACSSRGAGMLNGRFTGSASASASGKSHGWVVSAAVQLPLPPSPPAALSVDDSGCSCSDGTKQVLLLADVAPAASGGLLVAAAAPTATAGAVAAAAWHQQLMLFEVAGPPPPLLAACGGGQQQHHVARLSFPQSAVPPGAATVSLAFLPADGAAAATSRLLVVSSSSTGGGTTACLFTGSSSVRTIGGGLHTWQLQVGPNELLCAVPLPAAATTASSTDGASLALLLPGAQQLLCLQTSSTEDSIGSGATSGTISGTKGSRLMHTRSPIPITMPSLSAGPPGSSTSSHATAGLAVSPNGLFAAVAPAGDPTLLLLPLLQQPDQEQDVEAFMHHLGKRCCVSLLAGSSGSGCGWDLTATAAVACRRWGHQGLQATQQVVDAAVHAVRKDARPQYTAAWGRLKAALLAAAAAAHPAAAADLTAAALRADTAARDWIAVAADVVDQHLPDKDARTAAASKGTAALNSEMRAALVKMLPARYWALWAADFSCYLTRCLLYWMKLNQQSGRQREAAATKAAAAVAVASSSDAATTAAEAFTAEQNATVDCLPCIRLLSDDQFYRSFNRLVAGIHQFNRILSRLQRSKQPDNFTLMIQQLQLVQDVVLLLRTLHDACSKAQAEGTAAGSGGKGTGAGGGGVTSGGQVSGPYAQEPAGFAGAWTLPCGQPSYPVSWEEVAAALQKLKQQAGNSSLLARVQQHWTQQAEAESVEALLEAAAQLGLLPPQTSGRSGGAGGGASLAALVLQRQVALTASEAGEGLDGGPLPACLLQWGLEGEGGEEGRQGGGSQPAAQQQQQQQQVAWEKERNAALGLPAAASADDDASAYEGSIDVLTGRPLSWDHGITYAAADGSCATAELQPAAFAPASSPRWQAAYATATPMGGQRWKRLRTG